MAFQTLLTDRQIYNIIVDDKNMVLLSNLYSISSVTPCLTYVFKGFDIQFTDAICCASKHATPVHVYEKFGQSFAPAGVIL